MDPGDIVLTDETQVFIDQQLVLTASRTFTVGEGSELIVPAENIIRLSGSGVKLILECTHVEFPPGEDFPGIRLLGQIISDAPGQDDGGITKNGTGLMLLHNGNTYFGPTIINGGTVEILSDIALGSTGSGTTVQSGATLLSRANAPSEPLTIAGVGAPGKLGALMVDGTFGVTVNWLGPITLAGPASIGGAELILNLDGAIGETPPGAGHALT